MTRRSTWLASYGKFAVLVESSTSGPRIASGMFARTRAQCDHAAAGLQAEAVRQRRRRTTYTVVRIPDDVVAAWRQYDDEADALWELLNLARKRRDRVRHEWERSHVHGLPDVF